MEMELRCAVLIFIFGVFLILATPIANTINFTLAAGSGTVNNTTIVCDERERQALLTFKQHLQDPSNRLSSWTGTDCCGWFGVVCNIKTNKTDDPRVVFPHGIVFLEKVAVVHELQLQLLQLSGELNPSLLELKHLNHLDLSFNHFNIPIPHFLGSLHKLRYLNLAGYDNFVGKIPPQLGNLSSLRHLDLNGNLLLNPGDLEWLSHLSSLEYLNLFKLNLSEASNWLHSINMLPSLLELHLASCDLRSMPSDLSYVNFTSLEILYLNDNNFNTSYIPEWLYTLTNLVVLDLSNNHLQKPISEAVGNLTSLTRLYLRDNELEGEIPRTLGNLCNLQILYLSNNKLGGEISGFLGNSSGCIAGSLQYIWLGFNNLSGPLPDQLGRLQNLKEVHLSENSFSGSIPSSLGRLSLLKWLDLSHNKLTGSLPKSFGNLSNLETLVISYNALDVVTETQLANLTTVKSLRIDSVTLKLSPDWIPPFQLGYIGLRNCKLGTQIPKWLRTQKYIIGIDLSSAGISGTVPTWFWNMSSQFRYLNLSHNQLHGELPNLLRSTNNSDSAAIYLNSNRFKGHLPLISSNVGELDLSNNSISGPISFLLCNPLSETNDLEVLDLSGNLIYGELSNCWSYWKSLVILKLGSNNIAGKIPSSMSSLLKLRSLHLRNMSLSGEVPSSLQSCTELLTIDLGENGFTGSIPTWIGKSLPNLISLRLRVNKFYGGIPQELCHLNSLRLLDIAHNNLSGLIPKCFSNFSAMASKRNWITNYIISYGNHEETALLVTKGRQIEYAKTLLTLGNNMDLSSNSLSGEIPEELTSLFELRSLNLSENHFIGKIPDKIGRMRSLESLDFSNNTLSGSIPESMNALTFLGHLNLSYNNLSGKIPPSGQLQTFTELSYMGNQGLCGSPLKNCKEDEQSQPPGVGEDEDDDWFEMKWFYSSLVLGFAIGFWGFWGVLVVKKSWRYSYFGFLDNMMNKLWNCCSRYKIR